MWEKDKQLLRAYRECWANLKTSIEAGEEVDITSSCIEETEALTSYTITIMDHYKTKHPQEVSEKRQRYYTPLMPYFQNL